MGIRTLVKKIIPRKVFEWVEPTGHLIEAILVSCRWGFPAKSMKFIGVTGTNGKTTTVNMIHRMLHEAGYKVGFLSTANYGIGADIKPQLKHVTTESVGVLQRRLAEFKKAGVEWVVVESSSHGLAQHRIWGLPYQIAVMTNVTNDHLDYHKTFERYLQAKIRLFKLAGHQKNSLGIINAEDPSAQRFSGYTTKTLTYGLKQGQLVAKKIKFQAKASTFTAEVGQDQYQIKIHLPGDYNISNALASIAVGREVGLTKIQIEKGLESLPSVPGRMALVEKGQAYSVIIDFASTPDAFERVLTNVRPLTKGKLVVVFGSAGRRDEAKRAVQGEIAGRYADEIIITEEDDRDVNGLEILEQIASGVKKAGKKLNKDLFLVLDRTQAINLAMTRVKDKSDTVLLLGKGHEQTIERADGEHPWDEFAVAEEAILKNINHASSKNKVS